MRPWMKSGFVNVKLMKSRIYAHKIKGQDETILKTWGLIKKAIADASKSSPEIYLHTSNIARVVTPYS